MYELECKPATEDLSKAIVLMAPWKEPGSCGRLAPIASHAWYPTYMTCVMLRSLNLYKNKFQVELQ